MLVLLCQASSLTQHVPQPCMLCKTDLVITYSKPSYHVLMQHMQCNFTRASQLTLERFSEGAATQPLLRFGCPNKPAVASCCCLDAFSICCTWKSIRALPSCRCAGMSLGSKGSGIVKGLAIGCKSCRMTDGRLALSVFRSSESAEGSCASLGTAAATRQVSGSGKKSGGALRRYT